MGKLPLDQPFGFTSAYMLMQQKRKICKTVSHIGHIFFKDAKSMNNQLKHSFVVNVTEDALNGGVNDDC